MTYSCHCDYEPPEWLSTRTVKARKAHECIECFRVIPGGEPYEYTAGMWDGEFSHYKVCADCVALREWAISSVPCFCWSYGGLHEDVRGMVEEIAPKMPGFFFEYGRQMVKIRCKRRATA